ncbi:MAG: inositol-3-phosphate synthase [Nitrososphaeria archaeon]|nr:inositol-3-phosphate synthase [Conexivisphaerales archaeon]
MSKIKVAIAGVGNCASAIVQGVYYYTDKEPIGVISDKIGPYSISDIEFVAAFDVSKRKVGKDISEAIFEYPNLTKKFADLPKLGVEVQPGPVYDGVAPHMRESFQPMDKGPGISFVADKLRESGADLLINLLPVGSEEATRAYARAALEAKKGFINGIPVFIASDKGWASEFEKAGVPVMGDDVKGQVGATILHRTLVSLFHMRGVIVEETYQVNIGGNTDFLNMTVEERLKSKRISKTSAVTSILPYGKELEEKGKIRIGPSDYVPFLGNTKVCYIYLKGKSFADFPVELKVKLSVDDKSMFAAVMLDAIRLMKVALDKGLKGALIEPSSFLFKHPPVQATSDAEASEWLKGWLRNLGY